MYAYMKIRLRNIQGMWVPMYMNYIRLQQNKTKDQQSKYVYKINGQQLMELE